MTRALYSGLTGMENAFLILVDMNPWYTGYKIVYKNTFLYIKNLKFVNLAYDRGTDFELNKTLR